MSKNKCKKCSLRVDCLLGDGCLRDELRLERLQKILDAISNNNHYSTTGRRGERISFRDIIALHRFEFEFSGSRVSRRATARGFMLRYHERIKFWRLHANRGSFTYTGTWVHK